MMGLGIGEILVIVAVFVLFFGARHIPTLFSSLGKAPREFKKGLKGEADSRPVRDVNQIDSEHKKS